MSRSLLILLFLILLIALAVVFLASQAEEVPTRTIETDVAGENSER
jgi:regulatory protein YycI of two-component signal transduction system YycFG